MTWLMLLALLATPIVYVSAMMNDPVVANSLSPDADSWGIPMFGGVVFAIVLSPVILGVTWAATQNYANPGLLAWRKDRSVRSILWTLTAVAVIAPVLAISVQDYLSSPPLYEYDLLPLLTLGVLWVAMLRAAIITAESSGQKPNAGADQVS